MTQLLSQSELDSLLPPSLRGRTLGQSDIPRIAKDDVLCAEIEQAIQRISAEHRLFLGDSRDVSNSEIGPVQLVATSPPYWTLKEYRDSPGQLGHIENYVEFLDQLDIVWRKSFDLLEPGGRLICVVGDVCLSRRKNNGRHTVIPLHASIQERCREIGFDNLAPIIWHKIANAQFEVDAGGGFLGKPYEPNAVIKNDIEFILMFRKPGGYRSPESANRVLSLIPAHKHKIWFQQIWTGLTGASTRVHPAPYPVELAERLIRMFSFVGDTVFDPFMGTGTTNIAASRWGRNSIGVEIDPHYFGLARDRITKDTTDLFGRTIVRAMTAGDCDE